MSKFAEVLARVEAEDNAADSAGDGSGSGSPEGAVDGGENQAAASGDSGGGQGLDNAGNSADGDVAANASEGDVGSKDKPAATVAKPEPAPVAKTPEEERRAAQFAALKRDKAEALRLRGEVEARAKAIEDQQRTLQAREQELNGYLDNPKLFFEHLQKRHGIDSYEKLQAYASPDWKKGAPPVKEEDRPLTKAELQAAFEAEEQKRATRAAAYAAEQEFERIVESDEKYDAAFLVYSPEERAMHGHRIANELRAADETFTLADIADAVDELARRSRKYATIQGRYERKAPAKAEATAKGAVNPASTQRQPTASAKKPSEQPQERPLDKNGAPRLPHRERLQRLMRG